jgi:hypothetical protein
MTTHHNVSSHIRHVSAIIVTDFENGPALYQDFIFLGKWVRQYFNRLTYFLFLWTGSRLVGCHFVRVEKGKLRESSFNHSNSDPI